jgi:hypothetical protein
MWMLLCLLSLHVCRYVDTLVPLAFIVMLVDM